MSKILLITLPLAAASGVAMTFQGVLNGFLGSKVGLPGMALIVHLIGSVSGLVVVLATRSLGNLAQLTQVPLYTLSGGLLSLFIIGGVAYTLPRSGAALGISVILIGQLTSALLIDHLGLLSQPRIPSTTLRIVGVLLMILGARLLVNR
ncbi:MAG: DMT family transporter [Firmicutes bacterium]|nr:DMT family transporter [Bacillota bacterium]